MNRPEQHSDPRDLHRLLDSPPLPSDLHARLQTDLCAAPEGHRYATKGRIVSKGSRLVVLGLAAAMGWLLFSLTQLLPTAANTPEEIEVARAHARLEARLTGMLDGGLDPWLAAHQLGPIPSPIQVEMSKNCTLQGEPAKHLRLRLPGLRTVNLFIQDEAGDRDRLAGKRITDHWLIIRPRRGVRVTAIYQDPAAAPPTLRLIQAMFDRGPAYGHLLTRNAHIRYAPTRADHQAGILPAPIRFITRQRT